MRVCLPLFSLHPLTNQRVCIVLRGVTGLVRRTNTNSFQCAHLNMRGLFTQKPHPQLAVLSAIERIWSASLLFHDPLGIIGLVVGIIGLVVGLIGLIFAIRAEGKLTNAELALRQVRDEATTREMPGFPRNLSDITDLIKAAKTDELMIMADICAYALFSDPISSAEYVQQLKDAKRRGVRVSMLVYSHDASQKSMRRQVSEDKYNEEVKGGEVFMRYIGYFDLSKDMDYETFVASAMERENRTRRGLVEAGIKCLPLVQVLPAFMWLSTSPAAAMFALRNDASSLAGLSFHTRAPGLLSEFTAIFHGEWQASKKSGIPALW
jgi:hypothetical protein